MTVFFGNLWKKKKNSRRFFSLFVSFCYILGSDATRLTQSRRSRQHELRGSRCATVILFPSFFFLSFFQCVTHFLGSAALMLLCCRANRKRRDFGGQFWEARRRKCDSFLLLFWGSCQTSLLEQSGNGKWNVAFVKMLGAVFIRPATPCQIRGRCVQKKARRSLAEPRLTRNNLPTASEWARKTRKRLFFVWM